MGDVHTPRGRPTLWPLRRRQLLYGREDARPVDPDTAWLLDLLAIPGACPLFRRDADSQGVCPVHGTWPAVCEEYAYWRILALGSAERRVARVMVMGSRHIAIDDPTLEAVLAPHRGRLGRIVDDTAWDAALTALLEDTGYRVIR